jgi:hypothetical protein
MLRYKNLSPRCQATRKKPFIDKFGERRRQGEPCLMVKVPHPTGTCFLKLTNALIGSRNERVIEPLNSSRRPPIVLEVRNRSNAKQSKPVKIDGGESAPNC